VSYVLQKEQKGVVHAVEVAKNAIGKADFFLMMADEVIPDAKVKEMVKKFYEEELFALCGIVIETDKSKISRTYSAMTNEKNRVFRLVEKPRVVINNVKGTGHCIFKNEILDYIDRTPISPKRGERELVDWIQVAVDDAKAVKIFEIADDYTNINTRDDLEIGKDILNKKKKTVLIIHPQMEYYGGAELLIVNFANYLTNRGIKNKILTLKKSDKVQEDLERTELIVPKNNVNITSRGFESVKDILKGVMVFRKWVREHKNKFDVINFHNYPATWSLWPWRKPTVWMLNEPPSLWSRPDAGLLLKTLNRLRNILDKIIVNSIDVICVSDSFNQKRCRERYGREARISLHLF
jgi:dTDP-glucose pyrophosphorylase